IRRALGVLVLCLASFVGLAAAEEPTTFRVLMYGQSVSAPTLPEPAPAQPSGEGRMSLLEHAAAVYLPGGLADELSTEYFLAQGGHELNPVFRSRWVRAPYKLLVEPLAAAWAERFIEERLGPGWARGFKYVMWGSRFLVAVHNVRYGQRLRSGR
ncbi:MAG TPA: hypothetical protein VFO85_06455, partial [Vicinamibacteria bacterium]|nr:hypothetical protein [Vicinamibacteria bacterium]